MVEERQMKKENKTYDVYIDARCSWDFVIKAKNKLEARKKALKKLKVNNANFEVNIEEDK